MALQRISILQNEKERERERENEGRGEEGERECARGKTGVCEIDARESERENGRERREEQERGRETREDRERVMVSM